MIAPLQEHDLVRMSINQELGRIPGIHLPESEPLLGCGGQSWVFRAIETATGIPRALKVHQPLEGVSVKEANQSGAVFEAEGHYLSQFDHPNIIRVFSTGIHKLTTAADGLKHTKEYRYMLTELAELGSVADHIRRRSRTWSVGMLSVEEAVRCLLHATEGMRYAHGEMKNLPPGAHAVTHGDLKPSNLVITARGIVKVIDFGVARKVHAGTETMTTSPLHAFSRKYASPNQIRTGNVFCADDVYSLGGVTAYELLSGNRPFRPQEETVEGYLEAHENDSVPPMERMAGNKIDRIVEALNEPILTVLGSGGKYITMGEYQEAFKAALAKGRAEAVKARTILSLQPGKGLLPSLEELLRVVHPPDASTSYAAHSSNSQASSAPTEIIHNFPRDTHQVDLAYQQSPEMFHDERTTLIN